MQKRSRKNTIFSFLFLALSLISDICLAREQVNKGEDPIAGVWDPTKYISVDEVQAGMDAYCLTCYSGTKVEKFGLEVLDVIRNANPRTGPGSKDVILVLGTDERFIHTGPVGGCSGSPVYIGGRLAGALAFAWTFSKDPIYGVTPIKEMLRVGLDTAGRGDTQPVHQVGFTFDLSKPIDLAEIYKQIVVERSPEKTDSTGLVMLPCPLIVSGLPAHVYEELNALSEPFGLVAVTGGDSGNDNSEATAKAKLVPGASLAVPYLTGDITMTAIGAVTEVIDDKIYGLGHWLLGYGDIDLPMATAKIHAVVSNLLRSFKVGSQLEIIGALRQDESTAVYGQIGAEAKMIPLTIRIDRYNDTQQRIYNCRIAKNQVITPTYLGAVVAGAALMQGDLPPHHMIEYRVSLGIDGFEPITYDNMSTDIGMKNVALESASVVALLMNNPYKQVDIESLDFDIHIKPSSILAHIWSATVSDTKVKPGEQIEVEVVVESFLGAKKKYEFRLTIPDNLQAGKYQLVVCGSNDYEGFLRKAVPYRFVAQNLTTMIEAIKEILQMKQDALYCLLVLPPAGITVEQAELPDLSATKSLILQDAARALRTQAYPHWLEESVQTGTIVADKRTIQITVEK